MFRLSPKHIIPWIGRCLLWLIGWKPIDVDHIVFTVPKCVIIFSHTSYCDFFIFLVYAISEPRLLNKAYTVMSPYYYYKAAWLFKRLGVLPATSRSTPGQGFVSKTSEFLNAQKSFYLLISPEGSILKTHWRSGYYALAKSLNCPIVVAGGDYEKKYVYLSHPHTIDYTDDITSKREIVEPILQKDMENVVALHPEESFTPSRSHDPSKISIFQWDRIIGLMILISFVYPKWYLHWFNVGLIGLVNSLNPMLIGLLMLLRCQFQTPLIGLILPICAYGFIQLNPKIIAILYNLYYMGLDV